MGVFIKIIIWLPPPFCPGQCNGLEEAFLSSVGRFNYSWETENYICRYKYMQSEI